MTVGVFGMTVGVFGMTAGVFGMTAGVFGMTADMSFRPRGEISSEGIDLCPALA